MMLFPHFPHSPHRATRLIALLRLSLLLAFLFPAWAHAGSASARPESSVSAPGNSWEAGRLDYSDGSSEVAAFINGNNRTQLQIVLCSLNSPSTYRMILLLPHSIEFSGPVAVSLSADGLPVDAYGEIMGNSIEFQVGLSFLISLPDAEGIDISFSPEDAKTLGLPGRLHFSAADISSALSEVSRTCTILCLEKGFECNRALLSGMLWPRRGFEHTQAAKSSFILSLFDSEDDAEKPEIIVGDDRIRRPDPDSASPEKTESVAGDDRIRRPEPDSARDKKPENAARDQESRPDAPAAKHDGGKTVISRRKNHNHYAALGKEALDQACLRWPRSISGYDRSLSDMYNLTPSFTLNDKCRRLLNQRYAVDGIWPLAFVSVLFKDPDGAYQRYRKGWNDMVRALDPQNTVPDIRLEDEDYYLMLYALFTDTVLHEYPQSYFDMLSYRGEPETFLYAMDNRYYLETVKYYSVLYRRLDHSLQLVNTATESYENWERFYQSLSEALPPIPKASALRPVLYRQMLMRLWRLAGYPEPLHLKPEYAYVRGGNHKTGSTDALESKCSVFEGLQGDQFFSASDSCVRGIMSDLKRGGFYTGELQIVLDKWSAYEKAVRGSSFGFAASDSSLKSMLRAGSALPLLSVFKLYGFGDYFLLRSCLSTRDSDICLFLNHRSEQDYYAELRNILAEGSAPADELRRLSSLWGEYYAALTAYTEDLVRRGKLRPWRARFIQGVALTVQSETVLSGFMGEMSGVDPELGD